MEEEWIEIIRFKTVFNTDMPLCVVVWMGKNDTETISVDTNLGGIGLKVWY